MHITFWIFMAALMIAAALFICGLCLDLKFKRKKDKQIEILGSVLFNAIKQSERCSHCFKDDLTKLWHCSFGNVAERPLCVHRVELCPMLRLMIDKRQSK